MLQRARDGRPGATGLPGPAFALPAPAGELGRHGFPDTRGFPAGPGVRLKPVTTIRKTFQET